MLLYIWNQVKRWNEKRFFAGFERCSAYPHLRNRVWTKKQLEEQAEYFASQTNRQEYIVGVTFWDHNGDGAIYVTMCPGRHFHTIRWMWERGNGDRVNKCKQGFFTNKNRHISRPEARALALQNGQAKEENLRGGSDIFSEDLWETPEKYKYKGPPE